MSLTRSRPGAPNVRKGSAIGPDYPQENFRNPWNAGVDFQTPDNDHKTLRSPTGETVEGAGLPLHEKSYDGLWEGK